MNFHETLQTRHDPEGSFALAALMEVPSQLTAMLELGYFNNECQENYVEGEGKTTIINQETDSPIMKKQNARGIHHRNSFNHFCV